MIDDEVTGWLESQKKNIEGLRDSRMVAALVSGSYLMDPACMLQVGAAILMNKPIVLIVLDTTQIPPKLRGVADRIIRVKRDEMERASTELAEFVKGLK